MKILQKLARALEFVSEPGTCLYFLKAGKPSVASFRICEAVKAMLPMPATIFDVGANQGQFAGAAAWWFQGAQIISFEPSPKIFPMLCRNTRRISRLRLVQSALGDREGELDFFENEYSHASSALPSTASGQAMYPGTGRIRKISVPVTTLDAFAAGQKWPAPMLLKLDVQGFEKKVLQGGQAFLVEVEYLLFECSFRALYQSEPLFSEMYEYVSSLGFELVAPVGFLEDENHVIVQADLLWRRRR